MSIVQTCEAIVAGYEAGQSGLDGELLERCLELADSAAVIARALRALRRLEWACSGVPYMETEYAAELAESRAVLALIPEN